MAFKLVNLWQTSEQRRFKYAICLTFGANDSWARRMRDWRLIKIARRYGFQTTTELIIAASERPEFRSTPIYTQLNSAGA